MYSALDGTRLSVPTTIAGDGLLVPLAPRSETPPIAYDHLEGSRLQATLIGSEGLTEIVLDGDVIRNRPWAPSWR